MKFRTLAAAVLILAVSLFGACAKQGSGTLPRKTTATEEYLQTQHNTTAEKTTELYITELSTTELSVEFSTFAEQSTTQRVTEEERLTTADSSTGVQATEQKLTSTRVHITEVPPTTRVPSTAGEHTDSTMHPGRVYKTEVVERYALKYGVLEHRYKTVYYQIIDGKEVEVGSEYTGSHVNRRNYSATYEELLPAAKENRETYREFIEENLRIVNAYRAEKGIAPLRLNEKMTLMACARAEEIAWSGEHSHTRPDGSRCFSIFREAGFETGTAGENLGYVFDSPKDVCQAWKDSKTHYENLMNPEFTEIGIGVAADPDESGKLCWANHFLTET